MKVKVMTYNIEKGFMTEDLETASLRLLLARDIVDEEKPDILILNEAYYGALNKRGILNNYRVIFGYPNGFYGQYNGARGGKGDWGGNAILSTFPLQAHSYPLNHKGAIRAQVQVAGQQLNIDVVHPSRRRSDRQNWQTLRHMVQSHPSNYIFTGDLNALHPKANHDWDALEQELQEFDPNSASFIVGEWKEGYLVDKLLGEGLIDAMEGSTESTVPTWYTYKDHRPGVRVDFFLHTPDLNVLTAYVLKNAKTERASDHYPIVLELDI